MRQQSGAEKIRNIGLDKDHDESYANINKTNTIHKHYSRRDFAERANRRIFWIYRALAERR